MACALAAALLTTPAGAAVASDAVRSTVTQGPRTLTVPAYTNATSLHARLPVGGDVDYRLPALPAGGQRVLGDWNGLGAQTPGTFVNGQWQLWDHVVRVGAPDQVATFGRAGDRPVTGDWNGDGVTDLGVVRGRHWLLTLDPLPTDGSAPVVWKAFRFGRATDQPVVGDWDGAGRDGIGVFRAGHWSLVDDVADRTHRHGVWYGTPTDQPVAGDWNGDGVDTIGVVRRHTWFLRNSITGPPHTRELTVPRGAHDLATTWRVPAVKHASTCPTRGSAAPGPRALVVPSGVLDHDIGASVDATGLAVRGSLEQAERYLLGAQYDALWRARSGQAYLSLLSRPGHDELAIRLPAMSALTVAIGMRTGAVDGTVVGKSATTPAHYVDQLVRSIACAHASVSPGGWGLGWETAHWAMLTGAAAWLVWDQLTPQTQSDVSAMLVAEADRQAQLAVPYWGRPDGTIVTPGDTKAEECAWNSDLLSLAGSMMPSAPDAALWRAKAAELAVAAYSTQSDLSSSTLVNGVSLQHRLQGFNAYPDGTVENHQRIHPDYASNIQMLWLSADFDALAGQSVPEAMFHNGGLVYSAFSTVTYLSGAKSPAGGTFTQPGGTVYVPGSNTVYYPQGDDWGVVRRAHFVSLDAHALVYAGYLGATGWPAADALAQHEQGQQALWSSSGATDGRTYSVDPAVAAKQDTYPGREEYAAQNLATAWLALYVGRLGVPALDTGALAVPGSTAPAVRAPASALPAP